MVRITELLTAITLLIELYIEMLHPHPLFHGSFRTILQEKCHYPYFTHKETEASRALK